MTARTQRAPITLPLPVTRPEHWTEGALCARPGANPTWFDAPHDGESNDARRERHALAKAVCAECPVIDACRDAIVPGDSGVRAGRMVGERPSRAKAPTPLPKPKPPKPHKNPKPIAHGTRSGARTHWRRGETPCGPCLNAENAVQRAARAKKKAS